MNAGVAWLIVGVQASDTSRTTSSRVNLTLNRVGLEHPECKGWEKLMSVSRKRFRIEEAIIGDMPIIPPKAATIGPMHREIMNELRSIRAQMAAPGHGAAASAGIDPALQQIAESQALLETYRAQIEQCEKLKVELDLIYDAINRTKREIAVLHGKSFTARKWPRSPASSAPWSAAPRKRPSRFWKPPRRSIRPPAH